MYQCRVCGYVFDSPRHERLSVWDINERCYRLHDLEECPNCASENFDTAAPCPICGENTTDAGRWDACPSCRKKVRERFRKVMNENFTKEELTALCEWVEQEMLTLPQWMKKEE